ncbi:MAG: hypothetical protein U9Q96_01575 [Patescibacteria group bacterium]|nr:hypothetical protein [Patescibacteria group bacterium]
MKFIINNSDENLLSLVRKIGYRVNPSDRGGFNCIKSIGNMGYPRFHIFISEDKDKFIFNLHLDQKKPSYSGSSAHAGEYDGEIIEREVERIKKVLES